MKKILCSVLVVFSFNLQAATTSSLLLKGKVNQLLSASITAEPMAASLPLNQSQTALKVANGVFRSNSSSGFKVTVQSTNLGKLKRVGGNQVFPYNLRFGTYQIPLSSAAQLVYTDTSTLNLSDSFYMSYTGQPAETMVAGDYIDTVTISISAL